MGREVGGVLDIDEHTISTVNAYEAGYIHEDPLRRVPPACRMPMGAAGLSAIIAELPSMEWITWLKRRRKANENTPSPPWMRRPFATVKSFPSRYSRWRT